MEKPRPVNPGVQAREKARSLRDRLPVALTLLLLGLLAVILIVVLMHLSTTAAPAASLLPLAWLWHEGGVGIRATMAVFL